MSRFARSVPYLMILALAPAATAGCAGGAAPTVERTDSAGVEIVVSGAEDRPMEWSFTERFELGGEDEGPESFYTLNASTLATDDAGRIHVLDFMNQRVVSFDAGGEFIREVGRKGGGPGEVEAFAEFLRWNNKSERISKSGIRVDEPCVQELGCWTRTSPFPGIGCAYVADTALVDASLEDAAQSARRNVNIALVSKPRDQPLG